MMNRGLGSLISSAMASSVFARATVELVVTDFGDTPCNGVEACTLNPLSGPFLGP